MEKKRVGVITFHNYDNYGAILQSFALQKSSVNLEPGRKSLTTTVNISIIHSGWSILKKKAFLTIFTVLSDISVIFPAAVNATNFVNT